MGMKKVYSCNICREEKKPDTLKGLNFSGMAKFKIDEARSTDGVHICLSCLSQLKAQLIDADWLETPQA